MRGRGGLAATGVLLVIWLLLPAPRPIQAVDRMQVGSWWRAGGSLPAPPHVPPGGLWVSGKPAEPTAISALRFELGDLEASPIVILRVRNNTPAGVVAVRACPATGAWQPATAGGWDARPAYDCGQGTVIGQPSADSKTVLFDLSQMVSGRRVDVVFVPSSGSQLPPSPVAYPSVPGLPPPPEPTFDVTFEAPSPADVSVSTGLPPPPDESFEETFSPPPAPVEEFEPVALGLPSTAVPLSPVSAPPPVPLARPTQPAGFVPTPLREASRTDRILAALAFCAIAAWWYRLSYRTPDAGRRLTLHDDPKFLPAVATVRVQARAAPPLR